MSISIEWRVVKPNKGHDLPGTSSDWTTYEELFGRRHLGKGDIHILVAMHRATARDSSLWGALADALHSLPDDVQIEVTASW